MSSNYSPAYMGTLMAKIQTGRVDIELDYKAILLVTALAIGYVIISASTMTKFKRV